MKSMQSCSVKEFVKYISIILLSFIAFMPACGGGGGGGDGGASDDLAIVSTTPADGATDVDVATTVQLVFNTPIDPATLESEDAGSFVDSEGDDVELDLEMSGDGKTLTLTPDEPLDYNETYTLTLYAGVVKNTSGKALASDASFSFTTEAQPESFGVSSRTPVSGAINVSISSTIDVIFNMPLSQSTVSAATFSVTHGGTPVDGVISFPTAYTARLTPATALSYGTTYTVTLTSGIQNQLGQALAPQSYVFSTATDPSALTVDSTTPVSAATGVSVSTAVTVVFNQGIDWSTVNNTTFIVKVHGTEDPISGNYNTDYKTVIFTPTVPGFAYGTQYDVTITRELLSDEGHALAANYDFSFTTMLLPDSFIVASNVPNDDATDVSVNAPIIITFNMAVNTGTVVYDSTFSVYEEDASSPVEGTITYSNQNTVMTFTPSSPLSTETDYNVYLTSGVKSILGGRSLVEKDYTFTTSAATHNSGDPDTGFGTGGLVKTAIGGWSRSGALSLLPDGTIIVGGQGFDGVVNHDFAIAGYRFTDGSLLGTNTTPVPDSTESEISSLAIQGTKMIAAGNWKYVIDDENEERIPVLARYNSSDGQLDTSFGSSGLVKEPFSASGMRDMSDVEVLDNNMILGTGIYFNTSSPNYNGFLVRYTQDGARDASFGTNGLVTITYGSHNYGSRCFDIRSNGKIVIGGIYTDDMNAFYYVLTQYNANGTLDTGFGTNGFAVSDITFTGEDEMSGDIIIQDDGKILMTGKYSEGGKLVFIVARFNSNGSVDTSFGTNGITTTSIGTGNAQACSITLDNVGNIVVAGLSQSGTEYRLALARYTSSGAPDLSFGTGGIVTMDTGMGTSSSRSMNVLVQPSDGKIVVTCGGGNGMGNAVFAVARFWS
jgi:uncharacterized delta-60 repeat protein